MKNTLRPWQKVVMDISEFQSKDYFVLIDYYARSILFGKVY